MNVRDAFNLIMQWLAAVGTVGATVTALWLGLSSKIEQARREHAAAILVAAGIAPLLDAAIHELRSISFALDFGDLKLGEDYEIIWDEFDSILRSLGQVINSPVFDHGVETCSKLLPISARAAQQFYAGRSLLRQVQRQLIKTESKGGYFISLNDQQQCEYVNELGTLLSSALDYLTSANSVFMSATGLAESAPTASDLFGEA